MKSGGTATAEAAAIPAPRTGIIDCDLHPDVRNAQEIRERMPAPFKDRWKRGGRGFFRNPVHVTVWMPYHRTAAIPSSCFSSSWKNLFRKIVDAGGVPWACPT